MTYQPRESWLEIIQLAEVHMAGHEKTHFITMPNKISASYSQFFFPLNYQNSTIFLISPSSIYKL
jgi:hypothetical protein